MTPFVRAGAAIAVAFVMLFGSTGCESFLASNPDEGTYVLESVGGMPLPALVHDDEANRVTILADTFRLQGDGSGTRVYAIDVEYLKEPHRNGPVARDRRVAYEVKGDAIEITDLCGPMEFCAPGPHFTGRITADELRLNGTPGPRIYRRVDR